MPAEKVETHEESNAALDAGYDLSKATSFAPPRDRSRTPDPGWLRSACMRMLSEMQNTDLDFAKWKKIIREMYLSHLQIAEICANSPPVSLPDGYSID